MNAIGPVVGGIAANNAGKYNQKIFRRNAQTTQAEGSMEREKIRFAARIAEGRQLVAQGGSGFEVGTGSALDELRESETAREMDLMVSRFNADSRAAGFRQQGNLARAQGKSALVGGIISGAATLANDVASAFAAGAGGGGASGADFKAAGGGFG